ncbi:MAG TPA: hypothetical protein VF194_09135 [Ferrovibrio sp.]|uniref:hypothetical protein n=1 Tax=Ferrovibrio sp. TaxID=1917215 RepID=UPI002ED00270
MSAAQISARDIWASAVLLIKRHGDLAAIEAGKKADQFLQTGDLAGQRIWLRIMHAIAAMTDTEGQPRN